MKEAGISSSLMKFTKSLALAQSEETVVLKELCGHSQASSLVVVTVIGATTQDEYRNTILKMQLLLVVSTKSRLMLLQQRIPLKFLQRRFRDLYQQHHNVILPDEVLKAAVDYSINTFHNAACQIRLSTLSM